jgi:thiol-disulfide isomerase/thioredoxin
MSCRQGLATLVTVVSIHSGALSAAGLPPKKPQVPAPKVSPVTARLVVGDPAPSLGNLVFLKGEPIHKLESGRLYLLEFWATWCTACKMLVPHLSQVARDYREKVTIISIDVAEVGHEGKPYSIHLPKVERVMKNGGIGMDYTVAMDDDDCTMMKNWLDPIGGALPSAVLVDQMGRIAWMGFPGETLPTILDLAVESKLDDAAIAGLKDRQAEFQKDAREYLGKIGVLARSKKYSEALALVEDRMVVRQKQGMPDPILLLHKYMLLTFMNPAEARKVGDAFLTQHEAFPVYLSLFAYSLISGAPLAGDSYAYQDCELALRAAKLAHAKGDDQNPTVLRDLAQAHALLKDYRSAVKYQELAIKSLGDYGGDRQKKAMVNILNEYRAKTKASAKP